MKLILIFLLALLGCKGKESGGTTSPQSLCGFERPPYIVRASFKNNATTDAELLLFGLHTKPEKVLAELNQLDDVIEEVKVSENLDKIIAMGDFNAGCSYLSSSEYSSLDLTTKGYNWVIPYSADTNVASSQCAYDRILTWGLPAVSHYNIFTTGITDQLSDHYPVETTINFNGNVYRVAAFNLQRYGPTKAGDSSFLSTVRSYIATTDIILLQEITTTDQSLINLLIPSGYDYVVSERLGTTSYKEQYAFVFNQKIQIQKDFVFQSTTTCPTPSSGEPNSCTSDGYDCGSGLYTTPGGQCRATNKDGENKRVRDCCCLN